MNCICCKYWGRCPVYENGDNPSKRFEFGFERGGFECGCFTPHFITPAQFKERTGREYSLRAPVFWGPKERDFALGIYPTYWANVAGMVEAGNAVAVCAFGDLVPPAGAVPAEEGKA
jgi:hypothetical protein